MYALMLKVMGSLFPNTLCCKTAKKNNIRLNLLSICIKRLTFLVTDYCKLYLILCAKLSKIQVSPQDNRVWDDYSGKTYQIMCNGTVWAVSQENLLR